MSKSLFPVNNGKTKKGNGVEFLMHQEKEALKSSLNNMKPVMNTRNNMYYTKMRDNIEE